MINLSNIHALDHFKRNTADFRARLKKTGDPEVLTVDGKAELVVQSAESYQKLLERMEYLETVAAVREGLADAKAGRTKPAGQVSRELRQTLGLPSSRKRAGRARRSA